MQLLKWIVFVEYEFSFYTQFWLVKAWTNQSKRIIPAHLVSISFPISEKFTLPALMTILVWVIIFSGRNWEKKHICNILISWLLYVTTASITIHQQRYLTLYLTVQYGCVNGFIFCFVIGFCFSIWVETKGIILRWDKKRFVFWIKDNILFQVQIRLSKTMELLKFLRNFHFLMITAVCF